MNSFMRADDVAKELGCKKSTAYKIIQKLNSELEKAGYAVMSGRLCRKYFIEKYCYGEIAKTTKGAD